MASDAVMEFTDDNFTAEVEQSDTPVLVDFWAEWCMPCRMLAATIDELAQELTGRVKVGKLDTDAHRNAAVKYGISNIPTVLLFSGGQVVHKFVGVRPKKEFLETIEKIAAV